MNSVNNDDKTWSERVCESRFQFSSYNESEWNRILLGPKTTTTPQKREKEFIWQQLVFDAMLWHLHRLLSDNEIFSMLFFASLFSLLFGMKCSARILLFSEKFFFIVFDAFYLPKQLLLLFRCSMNYTIPNLSVYCYLVRALWWLNGSVAMRQLAQLSGIDNFSEWEEKGIITPINEHVYAFAFLLQRSVQNELFRSWRDLARNCTQQFSSTHNWSNLRLVYNDKYA